MDKVMQGLSPLCGKAAGVIREAVYAGRPILIRFNNDADGICAGISIRRAVLSLLADRGVSLDRVRGFLRDFQNNGAVYKENDAAGDCLLLRGISEARPLIVLVDFGANVESVPGLKLAREEGCEIAVIDHHPHAREAVALIDCFVSPWLVEGGSSQYTAGLVSGEVAKKMARVDVEEFQKIALSGDKSALQPFSEELAGKALALDFLADTARPRNSLAKCEALLSDKKALAEARGEAAGKLAHAVSQAKGNVKLRELENGFLVAVIDSAKIARERGFPPNGKIATAVHEGLSGKHAKPVVTLGRGRDAINFRANKKALEAGFNATLIIEELKRELPNAITSGGGHDVAASLHTTREANRVVLDEIVKKIAGIGRR